MLRKTETISFMVRMTGCSTPSGRRIPGRRDVELRYAAPGADDRSGSAAGDCVAVALRRPSCSTRSRFLPLSSLTRWPTSRFCRCRRSLQPQFVELRQHAVLARHPAVAEGLPVVLVRHFGRIPARRPADCAAPRVHQARAACSSATAYCHSASGVYSREFFDGVHVRIGHGSHGFTRIEVRFRQNPWKSV